MLRNLLLTIGIVLAASVVAFPQTFGTLQGKITDKKTKEELPFVNVVIEVGGSQHGGSASDINGKYVIKPVTPGTYYGNSHDGSSYPVYTGRVTRTTYGAEYEHSIVHPNNALLR